MGTTLTKPVLLDETGQDIVDKLDEIKTAIGGTGEFIPIMIKVTTPPTKTNYFVGDTLDLSGIVVTLYGSNGGMYDITGDCTFSPADGASLSTANTGVSISYTWYKDSTVFTTSQKIVVNLPIVTEIEVATPPTKTSYFEGQSLDLTGMVVNANYSDGSSIDVTSSCVFSPVDGSILNDVSIDTISISYTNDGTTYTTSQSISVNYEIYGAEWDGTASSAWTRTDGARNFIDPVPQMSDGNGGWTVGSSPFDTIMPWSGMVVEENPDDTLGYFVKIPKYYYKWTLDGDHMKLQISPNRLDGFLTSPAHADRGDGQGERDFVYVGKFHNDSSNFYPGANSIVGFNVTKAQARTGIHNRGSNVWQWDYAMWWTINMLYLVEFADWDSQSKIGYGVNSDSNDKTNRTYQMTYHTGTTASGFGSSNHGHVLYRNIEDLWAGAADWLDGVYFSGNKMYCIKNPANFGESGGVETGDMTSYLDGSTFKSYEVKKWAVPSVSGFEYALYPLETGNGNFDVYNCDRFLFYSGNQLLATAGRATSNPADDCGIFGLISSENVVSSTCTSRSMILPSNS